MKTGVVLAGACIPLASAISLYSLVTDALSIPVPWLTGATELLQETVFPIEAKRLIELDPFREPEWVTDAEFWELKKKGMKMMDITAHVDTYEALKDSVSTQETIVFPTEASYVKEVRHLAEGLDQDNMKSNLANFSSFYTRYYRSPFGKSSSLWLYDQASDIAYDSSLNITVTLFDHAWAQKSVIATIHGKKNPENIVVVGAHQDSVNLLFPMGLRSPGADDDGSGTVTILETFKVLAESGFEPDNTIEFHWYSAEEGGLLGSQDIFTAYAADGKKVKAMVQQDMTGYIQTRLDQGLPEAIGIIVDFVNVELTEFIKLLVDSYCDLPYVESTCGYACSDHASASKAGYPGAFFTEGDFETFDPKIHSTEDTLDLLSFSHMAEIAKLDLAYAYELGFYEFA